ncbi:DEKNAAC104319 [Brettanomyces naardenensis]|uniref:NEDD8-activating enzyme E1 regulatory subunit n=1 Tax=Brettanomyces naardenensis TaxID=13370 RepID=A0A448YQH1_BRENA|nr:DEKNAAC104319 [Brettanomyces naardenensis]
MDDKDVGNKYDRQVRLWSPSGQKCLSNSSICLINANTTASETLKNLVLPGVGRITIIDNSRKVTPNDLASSFFLSDSSSDHTRAGRLANTLSALNPDVEILVEQRSLSQLLFIPSYWSEFSCVIVSQFLENADHERLLSDILWRINVCLIEVNSIGFYATLRIKYREQEIVETHDNNTEDLRLDFPWPELQGHIDSINLDELDDQSFSNVPYSIILTKVYQRLHKRTGKRPTPSAVRKFIQSELRRNGEETNLDEASNRAILVLKDSREIPESLTRIFEEGENNDGSADSPFWPLVKALYFFYHKHGLLPLSGVLPDMESDTEQYIALTKLYRDKFEADKKEIKEIFEDQYGGTVSDSYLTTFVKNCKFMRVHRGSRESFKASLLTEESENEDPQRLSNLNIYVGFLALKSFYYEYHRLPSVSDCSELRATAISLLCHYQSVRNFPDGLEKVLDEICRARGSELHNICALIGGIAGQEVIKVITNQYVTLDNCMSFDGIKAQGGTWRI